MSNNSYFFEGIKNASHSGMHGMITKDGYVHLVYGTKNNKFPKDKVNFCDSDYEIEFDGCIMNSSQLLEDNKIQSIKELLIHFWETYGEKMIKRIKGIYSLVIWDKKKQQLFISNDWLSKRDLYYAVFDDKVYYATSYFTILNETKKQKECLTISRDAAKKMIDLGSLSQQQTYIEEISYLAAFEYILVDFEKKQFLVDKILPEERKNSCLASEYIELFDNLFSNAVCLEYNKNEENGYKQVMALSGGMDSRACLLVAIREGFNQIDCFSYSQSKSIDAEVSLQLALDNGLNYFFYPLDSANFVRHMYEAMVLNECQQSGVGSTGAIMISKLIDFDNMGIIHTGLCGGELMGDLVELAGGKKEEILCRLLGKWNARYCSCNMEKIRYNMRACHNFSHMMLPNCEVMPPFLDEDVAEFILSIPADMLVRRTFYRNWMMKYVPNQYTTTYYQGPISISPTKELIIKAKQRLSKRIKGMSKNEMNPFDYWVTSIPQLKCALEHKFHEEIEYLENMEGMQELVQYIESEWNKGGLKKCYILTCIQALKDATIKF